MSKVKEERGELSVSPSFDEEGLIDFYIGDMVSSLNVEQCESLLNMIDKAIEEYNGSITYH